MKLAKRSINARELGADIDAGMSRPDLMEKYNLTTPQLDVVLKKLRESPRAPSDAHPVAAQPAGFSPKEAFNQCPACESPYPVESDECPKCGVIVSKYLQRTLTTCVVVERDEPAPVSLSVNTAGEWVVKLIIVLLVAAAIGTPVYFGRQWLTAYKKGAAYASFVAKVRPIIAGVPLDGDRNWSVVRSDLTFIIEGAESTLVGDYAVLKPGLNEIIELMERIDEKATAIPGLRQAKDREDLIKALQGKLDKGMAYEVDLENKCAAAVKALESKQGRASRLDADKARYCGDLERLRKSVGKLRLAIQEKMTEPLLGAGTNLTLAGEEIGTLRSRLSALCAETVKEMDRLR
jgi:hypothetical protein